MAIASSAFAATVDVSNLTPAQIAQVNKQVAEMSSAPANVSATVRKEAEAWGELGANMGKAIVGAAKEIGIAANEFEQTSLGKIVVAIVTYKIIGRDIVGIFIGSFILLFGYGLAIWLILTQRWSEVNYEYEPIFWGMFKRARIVSSKTSDEVIITKIIFSGILMVFATIVGLNVIF